LNLIFTPTGDDAEDRRLRRRYEAGELQRIINGVYLEPGAEPADMIIRRNWYRLVGKLVPGAVVTDRSGLETRPVQHAAGGPYVIYVWAGRSRSVIELPGLSINIRKGQGHAEGDIPYMGTYLAGPEQNSSTILLHPERGAA
jgi:hypothetical protein